MPDLPSKALKEWCHHINKLALLQEGRHDGFCACGVCSALRSEPATQQAQLVSGLFWSAWIDQVLYWLLVDPQTGRQRNPTQAEPSFYEKFRFAYPFPKIHSHAGRGQAPPWILLSTEHAQSLGIAQPCLPSTELIKEYKRKFWDDEVACWLESCGRRDVSAAAESTFREDVVERFPEEWNFLADWFLRP